MRTIHLLFVLCLFSCSSTDKQQTHYISAPGSKIIAPDHFRDSMQQLSFDTSSQEGCAQKLLNDFNIRNYPMIAGADTLFDLNYDGRKDLIIRYYTLAGTGIKNRIEAYPWSEKENHFIYDSLLSSVPNPSFYIKQKTITGFYIGLGGGDGIKLKWKNQHWDTATYFLFENRESKTFVTETIYPEKKTSLFSRPLFMIPPEDLLENE